jgi:hypothetical protein
MGGRIKRKFPDSGLRLDESGGMKCYFSLLGNVFQWLSIWALFYNSFVLVNVTSEQSLSWIMHIPRIE